MSSHDDNIEQFDDTEANISSNQDADKPIPPIVPPEGGVAGWLCIVGCSMCLFSTFGFLNAYVLFPSQSLSILLTCSQQNRSISNLLSTPRTQSIYTINNFMDIRFTVMSHVASSPVIRSSPGYLGSHSCVDPM